MTEFNLRQRSPGIRPIIAVSPASLLRQAARDLKRYLLISTGLSSAALGLTLIVSFFLAAQGGTGAPGVEVSQIHGRMQASALGDTPQVVSPALAPSTANFPAASPAPPLDVERREAAEPSERPFEAAGLKPPSPPATGLDLLVPSIPLDEAAAALAAPPLAQAPEVVEPVASVIAPPGGLPREGEIYQVNITFYDCVNQGFCGAMYNGEQVYEGAAACSWDLPLGTRFAIENDPTRRIYVCSDRGLLPDTWVDIYFYAPQDGWDWQQSVGRYATVHILAVPSLDPPF